MSAILGRSSAIAALALATALLVGGVASAGNPNFLMGTWLLQEA